MSGAANCRSLPYCTLSWPITSLLAYTGWKHLRPDLLEMFQDTTMEHKDKTEDNVQAPSMNEKEDDQLVEVEVTKPPNGGLTAWMQVVAAFFIFFNTW